MIIALLTFALEFDRIWKQKFSGATLLFLLNRYITPLQFIIIIVASHHPKWTGKKCDDFVLFEGATSGALASICELIMILRVYGLYSRSNRILGFLMSLWLVQVVLQSKGVSMGFAVKFPPGPAFVGCILTGPSNWFAVIWVSALVGDSTIFFLTVWRVRQYLSSPESLPILHIIMRDGTMYFLAIFLMNLVNVLMFFFAREDLKFLIAPFSAIMTCVLLSRLVLNLRAAPSSNIPSSMALTRPKEALVFAAITARVVDTFVEDFETAENYDSISSDDEGGRSYHRHDSSSFQV
ncbi:hypothetical protein NLJ89_g5039 [Agrocybe chaxingu]|uniref:DUF6533 domain-containing protein n=1 Tax=Agrocybe chaxingu TaxID=84603 RepID=A0A9W8MVD6_9AGAR|nr:hypothetical protein NLJ89_g5039 [Agrocybe chaxingu]